MGAPTRSQVIEANRLEHAMLAREYEERTWQLATTPSLWNHWYYDHLRTALTELRDRTANVTALDALGGTGKTALFLQQHGARVTLCDVSPEMTSIYQRIAGKLELPTDIVVRDIESYLADETTQPFWLITASSALHHLLDYDAVLCAFYDHLEPGGFLHTAWDPLPRSAVVTLLGKVEYYAAKLENPQAAMRGARRRVERIRAARNIDHEFHKSIDDRQLIRRAEEIGFVVRIHHRNAAGSISWTRPIWQRLGAFTTFALLLERPRAKPLGVPNPAGAAARLARPTG